jgi:DNA-binding NarL/FixJ family response regulator
MSNLKRAKTKTIKADVKKVSVLITDDYKMVRDGIKVMLQSVEGKTSFIVSEASSGEEAVKKAEKKEFDIVLMDYQLPGMDGADAVRKMIDQNPSAKIIALSNYDETTYVSRMMQSGARGYILKNIEPQQLYTAIDTVLNGKKYYSNDIAVKLIENSHKTETTDLPFEKYGITKREIQIMKLITLEYTNEEIADELNLSKRTVDSHRQNLLNKLHVKNTVGLIKFAMKHRLVEGN